nr:unnamed protein product [Callosobruchus analis]
MSRLVWIAPFVTAKTTPPGASATRRHVKRQAAVILALGITHQIGPWTSRGVTAMPRREPPHSTANPIILAVRKHPLATRSTSPTSGYRSATSSDEYS